MNRHCAMRGLKRLALAVEQLAALVLLQISESQEFPVQSHRAEKLRDGSRMVPESETVVDDHVRYGPQLVATKSEEEHLSG